MPPVLTDDQKGLVERVTKAYHEADKRHKVYRPRWEHYFKLYNNYRDIANRAGSGQPRDWDPGLRDWARRQWGAELFIPMVYSTVETVVPRVVEQQRMLVLPRPTPDFPASQLERLEDNAQNHRILIDAQQEQAKYELTVEDVGRNGLIYGLGPQKTFWRSTRRTVPRPVAHIYTGQPCVEHREEAFEDPYAEAVDPFDFFWDPMGHSIETCAYIIHRCWRNSQYVADMLASGAWQLDGLTPEDYTRGGAGERYDSVWAGRMQAQGLQGDLKMGELHEVWEFHDGAEVITILDRQWPVQRGANPTWHGELPFQVYRPTRVPGQMVGIGEIQPIEDLQLEINTLRSQRRDNATLTLMQTYAYSENLIDPADIRFGAGTLIPVEAGVDPREVLYPIQTPPIPNAGYQEEAALQADFDRTSGISDSLTGADPSGGVSATATGAQLVTQAANKRIARKARRLGVEVVARTEELWIQMNQRHVMALPPIQKPMLPSPDQPDRRYQWVKLSLEELAGDFMVAPDAGQPLDDNPVAQQNLALQQWNMLVQAPEVDRRALVLDTLRKLGHKNPEAFLAAPQQQGPDPGDVLTKALDNLQAIGVPKEMIARAVLAAQHEAQTGQPQGPTTPGAPLQPGPPQQGPQQQLPPGQPVPA